MKPGVGRTIGALLLDRYEHCADATAYYRPYPSDPSSVLDRVFSLVDKKLVGKKSKWFPVTWSEAFEFSSQMAAGLRGFGLSEGDTAVIVSGPRAECFEAALGCLQVGATIGFIDPKSNLNELERFFERTRARFAFVEDAEVLSDLMIESNRFPNLEKIFVFESIPPQFLSNQKSVLFFETLAAIGARQSDRIERSKNCLLSVKATDRALALMSSGVEGEPEVVVYSHRNIFDFVGDIQFELGEGVSLENEVLFSITPFSSPLGVIELFSSIYLGWKHLFPKNFKKAFSQIKEVNPTICFVRPLFVNELFEKICVQNIFDRVELVDSKSLGDKKRLLRKNSVQTKANPLVRSPITLKDYSTNSLLGFRLAKNAISLVGNRLKKVITGGQPLLDQRVEILSRIGIQVINAYTVTELGVVAMKSSKFSEGSQGYLPLRSVFVKTDSMGRLQFNGDRLAMGYLDDRGNLIGYPTYRGWYETGDIGFIDDKGLIRIFDRANCLIHLENNRISPIRIEQKIEIQPFVQRAFVTKKGSGIWLYIQPNKPNLMKYAEENQILASQYDALLQHPKIQILFEQILNEVNEGLSNAERPFGFDLVAEKFTRHNGLVAPDGRLRRLAVRVEMEIKGHNSDYKSQVNRDEHLRQRGELDSFDRIR